MDTATDLPAPDLGPLIRRRRKRLGLTLKALCDRAGLSAGYLSQLERGQATPTLGTLAQIARGLGVEINYFVSVRRPSDALSRAETRPVFRLAGDAIGYEALASDYPGSELSSYILHVPPGYVSETVSHAGEELILILEGRIKQTLGAGTFTLGPGDSLHYDGATPHGWSNPGPDPARLVWTGKLDVLGRGDGLPPPITGPAPNATEEEPTKPQGKRP